MPARRQGCETSQQKGQQVRDEREAVTTKNLREGRATGQFDPNGVDRRKTDGGRTLKSWTREHGSEVDVHSLPRLERAAAHVVVAAPRRGRTATRVGLLSLGRGLFHERKRRVTQYVVASAHPGTETRCSLTTRY